MTNRLRTPPRNAAAPEDFHPSSGAVPPPPGYQSPAQPWLDEGSLSAGHSSRAPDYLTLEDRTPERRPRVRAIGSPLPGTKPTPPIHAPPWSLPTLLVALAGWSLGAAVIAWVVLSWVTGQLPGL